MVPHHGTNWAALRLTSQIGRDAVLSESYGRGYWYFSPRTKRTPAPLRQAVCPPTREPALKREAGKPTGPKDRKLVGARRGVHVLPYRQPKSRQSDRYAGQRVPVSTRTGLRTTCNADYHLPVLPCWSSLTSEPLGLWRSLQPPTPPSSLLDPPSM